MADRLFAAAGRLRRRAHRRLLFGSPHTPGPGRALPPRRTVLVCWRLQPAGACRARRRYPPLPSRFCGRGRVSPRGSGLVAFIRLRLVCQLRRSAGQLCLVDESLRAQIKRRAGGRVSAVFPRANMDSFMAAAVAEAEAGLAEGGIPIGSVLVHQGRIIGRGHNRRVQKGSAILHGEMDALENSGRQLASVYAQSIIYTTRSPCAMCSGAILLYKIPRVIIGENQTFMGEEELLKSRGVTVEVLQDPRCIELMRNFITANPSLWNEDIGV